MPLFSQTLCAFSGWFPEPARARATGLLPYYLVTRNRRPLSPGPYAGKPVKGAWESVITLETWAALEIHNSVPSLHLSSPPGPAPLGSFIFVLMAALDNGAAEKSQKVKTQLWHYWPSLSSSRVVHQSTVEHIYTLICSLETKICSIFFLFRRFPQEVGIHYWGLVNGLWFHYTKADAVPLMSHHLWHCSLIMLLTMQEKWISFLHFAFPFLTRAISQCAPATHMTAEVL